MLASLGRYSNFWAGMSDEYYYERTDTYDKILHRKKGFVGCHTVPMVHSSVLVNLRRAESAHLTYMPERVSDYDGPFDDIIVFAISAAWNNVELTVCNEHDYGYVMLPQDEASRSGSERETMFPNLQSPT
jgi:collagen beta-1,O-galactosyltransferase